VPQTSSGNVAQGPPARTLVVLVENSCASPQKSIGLWYRRSFPRFVTAMPARKLDQFPVLVSAPSIDSTCFESPVRGANATNATRVRSLCFLRPGSIYGSLWIVVASETNQRFKPRGKLTANCHCTIANRNIRFTITMPDLLRLLITYY